MWEEYVQVELIFGVISVVVGPIVVGINVIGHHLLRAVYKGFRIANGFSIVILVFIKLFNLHQVNCSFLKLKKYTVGIKEIFSNLLFCANLGLLALSFVVKAKWQNIAGLKNLFSK